MSLPLTETDRRQFHLKVLGKTLEHLGVQMYKRRDTAIAELVANCWDAGAENVYIEVPEPSAYDRETSRITIRDDGLGMVPDEIQDAYLVVGRDRREFGPDVVKERPVMGRKGIGKLAGFGIASRMVVLTWRNSRATQFTLNVDALKEQDNEVKDVPIEGRLGPAPAEHGPSGTVIRLERLKHATPINVEALRESLARRFSRTTRGSMVIHVSGAPLQEPELDLVHRFPDEGNHVADSIPGPDGGEQAVRYHYAFAKNPIRSAELRGFTVYVRGKTAQSPPFFFFVEGTASGQHGTKYVTGAVEADFLDEGDTDLISTDRQEIDWEADEIQPFREWGEKLSRRVLREWAERKGETMEAWLLEDSDFRLRIETLDDESQKQVRRFLKTLSKVEGETPNARSLADALVQAYEFRHFHSVIHEIEATEDDPEQLQALLTHLRDWQVLESRAILEIVKGRLDIVDKFHGMIVGDAPETAPRRGADNIHDLLAGYPWLLNPEWQVLAEEKTISKQLREWAAEEVEDQDQRLRFDFLALADERRIVVVDIKRPGNAVDLDELQRLETYKDRLARAGDRELYMVMLCSGNLNVSSGTRQTWERRDDGEILTWSKVFERAKRHYEHYRAVLEKNISDPSFARKQKEVAQTRRILETGTSYRGPQERAAGLGPQDTADPEGEEEQPV
jgi:Histidine kinase-, DNA gyrase B-, and HSP90-like ATPase